MKIHALELKMNLVYSCLKRMEYLGVKLGNRQREKDFEQIPAPYRRFLKAKI